MKIIDYYHKTFKETSEASTYLQKRGITVGEAIDRFRIGYANRTLGLKLPLKQVKAGEEIRARLQQLGLYRKTGREHFNGCVVFPITAVDGSGQIVDIYGRKISGHRLRKGTPLHMHLSNQGVWNVEAFQAGDEIILCNGLFNALTFWNAGYRNVTCTFGADKIDDHLVAFNEFGIRRVLVTEESCGRLGIDRADYRFSRREIREFTNMGHSQLAVHLKRLQDMEYLLVHRGGRGASFYYELFYDQPNGDDKFIARLIDVGKLKNDYDGTIRAKGSKMRGDYPGGFRGHSGSIPGSKNGHKSKRQKDKDTIEAKSDSERTSG